MNHNPRHLQTADKFLYSSKDSSVTNAPAMEVTISSSSAAGMHAPPTGDAAAPVLSALLLLPKSHWHTCHQGGTPRGVPALQSGVPVCCPCSASPLLSAVCSRCHTCPFFPCFFPGWLLSCNSYVIVEPCWWPSSTLTLSVLGKCPTRDFCVFHTHTYTQFTLTFVSQEMFLSRSCAKQNLTRHLPSW